MESQIEFVSFSLSINTNIDNYVFISINSFQKNYIVLSNFNSIMMVSSLSLILFQSSK